MALPANIATRWVEGQFLTNVTDGVDADQKPDAVAARGTATFVAAVPYLPDATAQPNPATMLMIPRVAVLDDQGYICTPVRGTLEPAYRGMMLECTDDPDGGVVDWTWNVKYSFAPVDGVTPTIESHSFPLPSADVPLNLTQVVKVPSSAGIGKEQAEVLAASAQASAVRAAGDAAEAKAASAAAQDAAVLAVGASAQAAVDAVQELVPKVLDNKADLVGGKVPEAQLSLEGLETTNGERPVGKGELVLNVLDNGALGDGTTDDAERFSAAIATAQTFGASAYVPGRRTYYLSKPVKLRGNVRVWSDGAVLKKRGGASSDRIFEALSNGAKGYGSSVENIIIEGFTFEGSFKAGDQRGASITLHHARNVEIRNNIFRECVGAGHAVDLAGCCNVRIHDNTFAGFNPQPAREYAEAIQLDHSTYGGISGDQAASYDGLPTVDVTIRDNRFVPLVKDGVTYPAPNPVGSHSRVIGQWIENIKFLDNYVQDAVETFGITDPFAASIKGWLHFYCARDVTVRGNTFKVTDGRAARVFGAHAITTGLPVVDAANEAPVNVAMTPMPMTDLDVSDNTFIGFKNVANEPLVRVTGSMVNTIRHPAANLDLSGNRTRDCYPTPGAPADIGTRLFDVRIADDVTVEAGKVRDIRGLGSFTDVTRLTLAGITLKSIGWVLAEVDACRQVSVTGQKVGGYAGGFWFRNCVGLDAGDNQFDGGTNAEGNNFAAALLINGCTQWKANGNIVPAASNAFPRAINVYGATTKGMAKDNILVGFATPVTDTSTAKDTVISGTIN